jgi:hypothetical protein
MSFKLGVLLIHGIGNQGAGYASPMIEELKARVRRLGSDDRQICFEPVWWAPVLAKRQENLLRYLADGNDLDWMDLRRFVVHTLADAIAYQDTPTSKDQINVYRSVHDSIRDSMRALRDRIRIDANAGTPEAPLVVIAHSLGCHMISNYIWDTRHLAATKAPKNPFERFETLASIITFGCNIPLFTLAYTNLEPIQFPTPNLQAFFPSGAAQAKLDAVTKWLNFYDPDDILGYPLKSIDPKYDKTVTSDTAVNVGGLLRSWNPTSHSQYWTDNSVTVPVAELLHGILSLL